MSGPLSPTHKYDDIIDLPHHVSKDRPQMTMLERAAQFSPFAALSGYGDAVEETARFTERRIEPEEWESGKINAGLVAIRDELGSGASPRIRMVYFVPDGKKEGGGYRSVTASVRKIDEYLRILILENGLKVSFDNIGSLELQKPGM